MDKLFTIRGIDPQSFEIRSGVDESYFRAVMRRFLSKKTAVVGLVAVIIVVLLSIFAPMFSAYRYDEIISVVSDGQEVTAAGFAPTLSLNPTDPIGDLFAGKRFIFGTDDLGRDLWVRTWRGARVSIIIAFVALIINVVIGVSFGLISGYFGGRIDSVMQHITEIINSIPTLVIVAVLSMFLPKGIGLVIAALVISGWIQMNKIARSQVMLIKNLEYVDAARTMGASKTSIIFKTILPNSMGPVITQTMFAIPSAIFTESFLSFVGVGIRVPDCSIGSLIQDGFSNIITYPHIMVPPLMVLVVLMLSFNAIGDGFMSAFKPSRED